MDISLPYVYIQYESSSDLLLKQHTRSRTRISHFFVKVSRKVCFCPTFNMNFQFSYAGCSKLTFRTRMSHSFMFTLKVDLEVTSSGCNILTIVSRKFHHAPLIKISLQFLFKSLIHIFS